MKAFIYVRKSTDDKTHQVLSTDTQLYELRKFAAEKDLFVVDEITEERTARTPGRPKFGRMVDRLMRGEADGILCWKLHRLARNFDDGGKIITLLQTGTISVIHTLERSYFPQDNVLLLAIEFGIATQFSKDLSNDVKMGLDTKLRNGGWPGMAPTGYLNDKSNNSIRVNPSQAILVTEAFTTFATGRYTVEEVWRRVREAGLVSNRKGKPLSRSSFDLLLRNPFYYGVMRYRGELAPGKHVPIVSKVIFDQVQQLLSNRHKPRSTVLKPFAYRGFLHCFTCGCLITMENQKGHTYLRCTKRVVKCTERYLREETMNEQICLFLKDLRVPPSLPDLLLRLCASLAESDRKEQQQELDRIKSAESGLGPKATNSLLPSCRE